MNHNGLNKGMIMSGHKNQKYTHTTTNNINVEQNRKTEDVNITPYQKYSTHTKYFMGKRLGNKRTNNYIVLVMLVYTTDNQSFW